jgi:hypothetical protein
MMNEWNLNQECQERMHLHTHTPKTRRICKGRVPGCDSSGHSQPNLPLLAELCLPPASWEMLNKLIVYQKKRSAMS